MANFSVRYSPRVLIQEGYLKTRNLNMVAQLFTSIEGMDTVTLNYWLSKFVTELAKKSGESRHASKVVYGIICGIRRFLEAEGEATSHHLFSKNVQL